MIKHTRLSPSGDQFDLKLVALRERGRNRLEEGPEGFVRCSDYFSRCEEVFRRVEMLTEVMMQSLSLARKSQNEAYLERAKPVISKMVAAGSAIMDAYDNIYIKDHIFDRMTGMMEELACEVEEHLDEIQEASQELYALGSITKQQRRKSKRGQVDHG